MKSIAKKGVTLPDPSRVRMIERLGGLHGCEVLVERLMPAEDYIGHMAAWDEQMREDYATLSSKCKIIPDVVIATSHVMVCFPRPGRLNKLAWADDKPFTVSYDRIDSQGYEFLPSFIINSMYSEGDLCTLAYRRVLDRHIGIIGNHRLDIREYVDAWEDAMVDK